LNAVGAANAAQESAKPGMGAFPDHSLRFKIIERRIARMQKIKIEVGK
jgi:hypothetical protein